MIGVGGVRSEGARGACSTPPSPAEPPVITHIFRQDGLGRDGRGEEGRARAWALTNQGDLATDLPPSPATCHRIFLPSRTKPRPDVCSLHIRVLYDFVGDHHRVPAAALLL